MSRVVIPEGQAFNAYHMLKLVASYGESLLENSVLQHVSEIFPDHFVIPFKKDIESTLATNITKKRPDLAIIDRDFKSWGVVEVEIAGHSLTHVLDQVNVFVTAKYNPLETARYIKTQLELHCRKRVSEKKLEALLIAEQPKVLVIVDEVKEEWRSEIERAGADLCSFEIYKNTKGKHLFRTCGKYPIVPIREAHVRRIPARANVMEIASHFEFKKVSKGNVMISYGEIMTAWSVISDSGKQYLQFEGVANPLIGSDNYVILADRNERYYLRKN